MQLRKFYGRSLAGTLARVRQALGDEALILETNELASDSAAARVNPGARFEIIAVRDQSELAARGKGPTAAVQQNGLTSKNQPRPERASAPKRTYGMLADLAELKAQLSELLDSEKSNHGNGSTFDHTSQLDLSDYRSLIAAGVNHSAIAPHFRAWLQWRTASPQLRQYLAVQSNSAARMQGHTLREWLLHVWAPQCELPEITSGVAAMRPQIVGLLGGNGAGKTTTLAKLSSNNCQNKRHKNAVVTFDTHRLGAIEQWRKVASLLDLKIHEIHNIKDLQRSMESWENFGWVGIDTPGGMNPESEAGRLYGGLLAQCSDLKTVLVLPATQQEQPGRQQMRIGQSMGADKIIFTRLDEARSCNAPLGPIVNLSFGAGWPVAGFATGTRVPEDYAAATPENLWRHMLAPLAPEAQTAPITLSGAAL